MYGSLDIIYLNTTVAGAIVVVMIASKADSYDILTSVRTIQLMHSFTTYYCKISSHDDETHT